ncbi:MAG: PAS domain-containing protein [Oscillochloridaceae bacterium]|nr:PAS domain-containing protein [Chloroflexaceae bacterium]MDW8392232.1 PAS domain-containing protein [Oscillochloridaceae bacterium]
MSAIFTTPEALSKENAALRAELARYRAIFEQLGVGIHVYRLEDPEDDRTLRMVAANPIVEELTGVSPANIVGKTLDENFPGLREQGVPQAYAGVVRSGQPLAFEVTYGDERVITSAFAVRAVPLPNDELAVMFDNITARKQVEQELRRLNAELEQRVAERTAALERSERFLHHVLETSPAAIYIKDLEGRFLLINRYAAQIAGRATDELIGHADSEFFPEAYVARWRAAEQEVARTGQVVVQEETAPMPDGIHTFLSIRAPMYDEHGNVFAISGFSTDITDRVRVEEELRQARERLQLIIDSLPAAVFWKDRNSIYQGCNKTFARFAGLSSPDEIVGKSDYDLPWTREESDSYRAFDRQVMESGEAALHIIETQTQADGRVAWASTNKIPLRDGRGRVIGILGTYEDITDLKRTEEALRESQQLLQTLFAHLPVAVLLKAAADGRFVLWNAASELLFGLRAEEVIGKTDYDFFPREQADAFRAKDREVLARGVTEVIPEEPVDSPHLGRRIVRTTKIPLYDERGKPTYLLVICDDLTERRRAEQERLVLQEQIIEAQQQALRELSTPLLPLSKRVVLLPIIGSVDTERALQLIETLLEGVARHRADIALIDITGVHIVDTQVANTLIQAARAVHLLGARVVLTGIRPEVAQTLVQLGVDLGGILTRGTLQDGIAFAFAQAGG